MNTATLSLSRLFLVAFPYNIVGGRRVPHLSPVGTPVSSCIFRSISSFIAIPPIPGVQYWGYISNLDGGILNKKRIVQLNVSVQKTGYICMVRLLHDIAQVAHLDRRMAFGADKGNLPVLRHCYSSRRIWMYGSTRWLKAGCVAAVALGEKAEKPNPFTGNYT